MIIRKRGTKDARRRLQNHAKRAMLRTLEGATQEGRRRAPVRTGRLKNQIRYRAYRRGDKVTGVISVTALNPETGQDYAFFVTKGTGIFGPKKQPIRAKNGGALKFKIGGRVIIRKSVKGMKPNTYLQDAAEYAAKNIAPAEIDREMREFNSAY